MATIKENFIKAVETLPYDIDKEISKKDTKDILKDVTQKYVDMFGTANLSEEDIECVESLIGKLN